MGDRDFNLKQYKMWDSTLDVNSQRFRCPEALFQPELFDRYPQPGSSKHGIHELVHQSLSICGTDIRVELIRNIVVCGGNARFEGMEQRMNKELQKTLFDRNVAEAFLNSIHRQKKIMPH